MYPSRHAPQGALVPAPTFDHREAKARTLAVLAGGDPLIAARDALEALAQRNRDLAGGDPPALREALADQVAILEAVIAHFAQEAAQAKVAAYKQALAGVVIRAQSTLVQVLGAFHRINLDCSNEKTLPSNT